ncbi:vomeronasal type-2 receptor 26-like [Gastrophryne carolinensis]
MYQYHWHLLDSYRYIDDILVLGQGSEERFNEYLDHLNTNNINIFLTAQISSKQVTFLDLMIMTVGDCTLRTGLYRKETAVNLLLHYESFHLTSLKQGIPMGQFLRVRRNCSNDEEFEQQAGDLVQRFRRRGFPKVVVERALSRARTTPRSGLLVPKQRTRNAPEINYETSASVVTSTGLKVVSTDRLRIEAIIYCLKKFDWNWVGIITPYDDSAELELRELTKEMTRNRICIAYIIKLSSDTKANKEKVKVIQRSTATVIIICGKYFVHYNILSGLEVVLQNITLILHESWIDSYHLGSEFLPVINGSLIVMRPEKEVPGLIKSFDMYDTGYDHILEDIHYFYLGCTNINPSRKATFQSYFNLPENHCSMELSQLTSLLLPDMNYPSFYSMQMAVYSLALAAHMILEMDGLGIYREKNKLGKYLRKMKLIADSGEKIPYDVPEELCLSFVLTNWIFKPNENGNSFDKKVVGSFNHSKGNTFEVHQDKITWKKGRVPQSRCSKSCEPGHRKAPQKGAHVCCYDCVPCSEGEISNVTDSENCEKCPNEEWPDEKKVICIPKTFDYLSYEDDLTPAICIISLLGFVICVIGLKVFTSFWDTPVVKANNRNLSILLLTSILLSFLCVFLFLGPPVDITCMLRQAAFGIFFTISVSSVLAKTITVWVAFKVTKPGSYWKKWVGIKLANYAVLICSSLQVLICVIWLSVSSPYQEYEMSSYAERIIIQCNEGSAIGFYLVLGYMGFLAAVSFVLAFMVRTLPDSFNEAKYITFSMLVFCSVWIAMIPAYLSTRGKYMVAVEIFAILTSSAGLLGCIFFPKFYTLLIKPEMNTKLYFTGKQ